jgi:hypothetical protein
MRPGAAFHESGGMRFFDSMSMDNLTRENWAVMRPSGFRTSPLGMLDAKCYAEQSEEGLLTDRCIGKHRIIKDKLTSK